MNKITIADVAKRAKVSKTSVSYVLSNSKRLSADVEKRIMEAVKELGYKPPQHAGRLSKEKLKLINFCLPLESGTITDDPYYLPLIEGAMEYTTKAGYHMIVTRLTRGDEAAHRLFLQSLDSVDGVLMCNLERDHMYEQTLIDANIPFVVNGTPDNGSTKYYVDADIEGIAYQAASYLLKQGHKNILYINLSEHLLQSHFRLSGFQLAHQENNIEWNKQNHNYCKVSMEAAGAIVDAALKNTSHRITAIVTSNEIQAWGAIKSVQKHNYNIPDQIALVSMGGSALSVLGYPNITTIDFSPMKIGREAAKMLIEVIERKRIRPSHLIVPGKLIEREST